jgi:hypothetical protein
MPEQTEHPFPSPPFPDSADPPTQASGRMLAHLVASTLEELRAGKITPEGAVVHVAVHAWYEGHIEGEDTCPGCDFRGDDPDFAVIAGLRERPRRQPRND